LLVLIIWIKMIFHDLDISDADLYVAGQRNYAIKSKNSIVIQIDQVIYALKGRASRLKLFIFN
jgi:hypothetical protein